jgi:hypothetical protein
VQERSVIPPVTWSADRGVRQWHEPRPTGRLVLGLHWSPSHASARGPPHRRRSPRPRAAEGGDRLSRSRWRWRLGTAPGSSTRSAPREYVKACINEEAPTGHGAHHGAHAEEDAMCGAAFARLRAKRADVLAPGHRSDRRPAPAPTPDQRIAGRGLGAGSDGDTIAGGGLGPYRAHWLRGRTNA